MAPQPQYENVSLDKSTDLANVANAAHDSVKDLLANGKGIAEFLDGIDNLRKDQMRLIVEQAIRMIEGFYVHLPLKKAMYGIDPLQQLRLLLRRLNGINREIDFHAQMTQIFTSLRDLHTNYLLPRHFANMAAILPFRVQSCIDGDETVYVVSAVAEGFVHPTFKKGVRLTHWGGIPIDRAVELAAAAHSGSNPAARRARGIEGLTTRALIVNPPPDEEFVVVGYRTAAGKDASIRFDWAVVELPGDGHGIASMDSAAGTMVVDPAGDRSGARDMPQASVIGLDVEAEAIRRVYGMLFAPARLQAEIDVGTRKDNARRAILAGDASKARSADLDAEVESEVSKTISESDGDTVSLASKMPGVLEFRVVAVEGRQIGHLRIFTFSIDSDQQFIDEVIRLLGLVETDGLLIDVRGNGGGLIWAGERLLQLFTPRRIEPTRYGFINTEQTLNLSKSDDGFKQWEPSIRRSPETGAVHSATFPITDAEICNDIGQVYYGPVGLITDGRCYSTTDIFAAGFHDHDIGPIIGVDDNTGAGGANVWSIDLINHFFLNAGQPAPLQQLPMGASMRVAIRRTLRVGKELGTELEGLGVPPTHLIPRTLNDVLNDNADLIARAAALLEPRPTRIRADFAEPDGWTVTVTAVDRVDVYFDDRPHGNHDIPGASGSITIPVPDGARRLELRAFHAGKLCGLKRT